MSKPVILCVDNERIVLSTLRTQLAAKLGDTYIYEVIDLLETIKSALSQL